MFRTLKKNDLFFLPFEEILKFIRQVTNLNLSKTYWRIWSLIKLFWNLIKWKNCRWSEEKNLTNYFQNRKSVQIRFIGRNIRPISVWQACGAAPGCGWTWNSWNSEPTSVVLSHFQIPRKSKDKNTTALRPFSIGNHFKYILMHALKTRLICILLF